MSASYAVGWLGLATFSRISPGEVLGGVQIGPQLLVGFGLALGWSLVLGIGYGRLLLTRPDARVRLPVPRFRAPSWQLVSIVSGAVIVVITVLDVASGGASASS